MGIVVSAAFLIIFLTFYDLSSVENKIHLVEESSLFNVFVYKKDAFINLEYGVISYARLFYELKSENASLYKEIGIKDQPQNVVVVLPIFTITAYSEPGFYNYYKKECDISCIKDVPIRYGHPQKYETSDATTKVLKLLGYPFITDIDIDKNPNVLKKFDKIILLHNEYVTSTEFEAITQHPKVIYLYPNALYAEIEADYINDTISLIRGHNYPQPEIGNGFDWKFDNSPNEYDIDCKEWEFNDIENGIMLNCYPEKIIFKDSRLLKIIKEY